MALNNHTDEIRAVGNPVGDAGSTPPASSPNEDMRRQAIVATRQSLAFGHVVSLLMQSPLYRHYAVADLEWLAVPPLLTGTFAIAEARPQADGPSFPVAAVLWACVSPDVDKRLTENVSGPIRLRPDEWRSGEQLWVIAVAGDPKVASGLVQQLSTSTFKGRAKICAAGPDGKVTVQSL